MASTKKVHNTHKSETLRALHLAVLEIVSAINRPQRDEALLAEAGLTLERALFPLLVATERFGPLGVVDLAQGVGRDYTTVSRQLARLESLGLVERRLDAADRRSRVAAVTDKGRAMTAAIDAARERLTRKALADWKVSEVEDLARCLRRFADALSAEP